MAAQVKLRQWRERRGLSLRDLQGVTGFAYSWFCHVEQGNRRCYATRQLLLARALDADLADLFDPASDPDAAVALKLDEAGLTDDELELLDRWPR